MRFEPPVGETLSYSYKLKIFLPGASLASCPSHNSETGQGQTAKCELRHIHRATTASVRPPRQTRTHILEGGLPGRCHVAQLHPAHERTHAISSAPLHSLAMSGPVSLQSGCGRAFAAFVGQWEVDDLAFRSYLPGEPSQR